MHEHADLIQDRSVVVGSFLCEAIGAVYPAGAAPRSWVTFELDPKVLKHPFNGTPWSNPYQYPHAGRWTIVSRTPLGGRRYAERHDILEVGPRIMKHRAVYETPFSDVPIEITEKEFLSLHDFVVTALKSDMMKYYVEQIRSNRLFAVRQAAELLNTGQLLNARAGITGTKDRYPRRPRDARALSKILGILAKDIGRGFPVIAANNHNPKPRPETEPTVFNMPPVNVEPDQLRLFD